MAVQNSRWMKWVKYIMGTMMLASFLFLILGELLLPAENNWGEDTFQAFDAEWERELPDGSRKPMTVPGQCDAKHGEWFTVVTTLPKDQEDTWICVRSMQQELSIYVGDELRKEYSTLDTQPVGKTSTMTYVFFELFEEDAGKELRMEIMSDSDYAGYVSDIYEGEKADITYHFYGVHMPSAIIAAFLFLMSIVVIAGCVFIRFYYKRKADIIHLGSGVLVAATWLLVESKIRQFIFPNSTVAMLMGFLMIAVLPYPLMAYLNSIQKGRYQKAYLVLGTASAINFALIVGLQIFNIRDFFETMAISHLIIVALIVTMAVTITLDIVHKRIWEYREVAVGFAILMLMGVFEISLVYTINAKLNGVFLGIGLIMLLGTAGIKTLRDLFAIEKEKQRAIAASESKAKFLANMSHEIRTPINTIMGMNEMVLRENQDETIAEYAYNIKNASQMLLGLVNEILDFSKIEAGKLEIVESDYKLKGMLQDVVLGSRFNADKKGLSFITQIDETMPSVLKGDELRIKQILNNLLSNAVKYTQKGSVTFLAKGIPSKDGVTLEFKIKDTGIGIKKEDMDKLFASFQRLELSKNRYIEGTGLGLNITKQLVFIMGGTITVESEYSKGSCFTVRIPQQVTDESPMGSVEKTCRESDTIISRTEEVLQFPDAQILVVDDTKVNLLVIKELLKRTLVQLDMASGGEECLAVTKNKKYDLILMDHMMPEPDGIQTLHMMRQDKDNMNQDTPVVVLTANALVGSKETYLKEGFADYLAKPVKADELEKMLGQFLGQRM